MTFHHHDVVGAKLARKRMKALRFSNEEIDAVGTLVELHLRFHGYGGGEWTDSAVRRYVRDAGDQLARLHVLTRADCTTRNRRKAERLRAAYDDLEERIERLAEQEELDAIRPDLDGNQIMEMLGIGPGREVGRGLPAPARAADRPRPDDPGGGRRRPSSSGGAPAPGDPPVRPTRPGRSRVDATAVSKYPAPTGRPRTAYDCPSRGSTSAPRVPAAATNATLKSTS